MNKIKIFLLILGVGFLARQSVAAPGLPAKYWNNVSLSTATNLLEEASEEKIAYRIFSEWNSNGTDFKIILIDPRFRNEKDMRLLGAVLAQDFKHQSQEMSIDIFDDKSAAEKFNADRKRT